MYVEYNCRLGRTTRRRNNFNEGAVQKFGPCKPGSPSVGELSHVSVVWKYITYRYVCVFVYAYNMYGDVYSCWLHDIIKFAKFDDDDDGKRPGISDGRQKKKKTRRSDFLFLCVERTIYTRTWYNNMYKRGVKNFQLYNVFFTLSPSFLMLPVRPSECGSQFFSFLCFFSLRFRSSLGRFDCERPRARPDFSLTSAPRRNPFIVLPNLLLKIRRHEKRKKKPNNIIKTQVHTHLRNQYTRFWPKPDEN